MDANVLNPTFERVHVSTATADGAASPATPLAQAPFQVQQLAAFDEPWALAFLPGTTNALVTEKKGHLQLWRANGGSVEVTRGERVVQTEPFLAYTVSR